MSFHLILGFRYHLCQHNILQSVVYRVCCTSEVGVGVRLCSASRPIKALHSPHRNLALSSPGTVPRMHSVTVTPAEIRELESQSHVSHDEGVLHFCLPSMWLHNLRSDVLLSYRLPRRQ